MLPLRIMTAEMFGRDGDVLGESIDASSRELAAITIHPQRDRSDKLEYLQIFQ